MAGRLRISFDLVLSANPRHSSAQSYTDIQLKTLSRRVEVFHRKIIKSTAPIGGVFQIELKWFNLKTVLQEGIPFCNAKQLQLCHCEEGKSGAPDVAISRYDICFCCAERYMVPGDCHVALLLAMTYSELLSVTKRYTFIKMIPPVSENRREFILSFTWQQLRSHGRFFPFRPFSSACPWPEQSGSGSAPGYDQGT